MDYRGFKDANELLVETDAETVRKQVLNAEPVPLHGLNNIDFYSDEFQMLYDQGQPKGVSTGFDSIDKLFNIQTGYLAVVTGYPSDGKSCFIDQILINVAKNYGWKTGFASPENSPNYLHAHKLMRKVWGNMPVSYTHLTLPTTPYV